MVFYINEIGFGEKRQEWIAIPGGGELKATVIRGEKPGKTLVVTAGVHGCEYIGIQAVRQLCKELNPAEMKGQVVLVPLVNEAGFYSGAKQIVPSDGQNINRVFPGDFSGTESSQIAKVVEQYLYPMADLLIDLHSGDINEMVTPFVFFPAHAEESVTEKSREAAKALSLSYRVASSSKNGLYSWAAQCGVPALLLERGGRGQWSQDEVDSYKKNVYEILRHLEILDNVPIKTVQTEIETSVYLEASSDGFWYPAVKEGAFVFKGNLLGELRDADDNLIERYEADCDGIVLYYTLSLGVRKNDPLIAYGKL